MSESLEDRIQRENLEQRLRASVVTGQSQKVEKAFDDAVYNAIEKSEGDRGGKVIGHTKSGKPIYAHNGQNVKHASFTADDHRDAAEVNRQEAAKHRDAYITGGGGFAARKSGDQADLHNQFAKEHEEQAKKKESKNEGKHPGLIAQEKREKEQRRLDKYNGVK